MAFSLPVYHGPDFSDPNLAAAPDARWEAAPADGVAPEYYHSTSMYPEYFKIDGKWKLAEESRMDSSVVLRAVFLPEMLRWTTSLSSAREEAARLPTPEIMMS